MALHKCLMQISMLLVPFTAAFAQAPLPSGYSSFTPINYIRTYEALVPETNPYAIIGRAANIKDIRQTTQYMDGLGSPIQVVVRGGSMSANASPVDMVSLVTYDAYGREAFTYLPYAAASSNGQFKFNPFQEQVNFYNTQLSGQPGETNVGASSLNWAYSETSFEPSSLNRVTKTAAPGSSWVGAGRGVEASYLINTAADAVRIWTVTDVTNDFGTYSSAATYAAGELYKNITQDENSKQVVEYKDKEGLVILKKVQLDNTPGADHTGWLCTYYIYDDFNRLRAVLQPKAVERLQSTSGWSSLGSNTDILNELAFRYEYDARNRMTMKKVPGAGAMYMVYDARDRLVMMQDANMRISGQEKWLVTVYDNDLNRPTQTGLLTNNGSFSIHAAAAYNSTTYPSTASNFELLTETHYDDYNNLPSFLLSGSLFNSGYASSLDAPASLYPEPTAATTATKGMITWTRTKVLGTASQFTAAVSVYDEKGRVIQVQMINETGGLDVVTNQYSFSGQLLRSHTRHQNAAVATMETATKNNYDDLGRLASVEKKANGNTWKPISTVAYDALGRMKTKKIAPDYNGGQGLETMDYTYNVRGWLLGVNKADLAANGSNSKMFGFELGYDKQSNTAGRNYTNAQYNGNITGMIWKSAGDGIRRKYDYSYDNISRLMQGLFEQDDAGGSWSNNTVNYNVQMGDGVTPNSAYDANGNIKQMQQWGIKGVSSAQIDNLTYAYNINNGPNDLTNKLYKVSDANNDPATVLGDFKDGSNTGDDYTYDGNGNLLADGNKAISSITYNHLNLPQTITTSKGTITYIYDAAGNKLKKITSETAISKTTTTYYVGGFVYEQVNTDPVKLLYFGQEEGRIRPIRDAGGNILSYTYDYSIKDHLGNVRMMLTEEHQQDDYPFATLEPGAAITNEQNYYDNLTTGLTYPAPPPFGGSNNTVQLLRKNTGAIGSAKLLKVMAKDHLNARVDFYYPDDPIDNSGAYGMGSIISSLTALLNGSSAPAVLHGSGGQVAGDLSNNPSFINLFDAQTPQGPDYTLGPKAYLNILFFDEQFRFVAGNSQSVQTYAPLSVQQLTLTSVEAPQNGYVYIYISNESNNFVYFDNFQVSHDRGPLLEETHYYPFGLTMQGISSKAAGKTENRKKFNDGTELQDKEFSDGSGLDWYATDFRSLDPQLGRFWQIDPLAILTAESTSPYSFASNNPISINDPLGLADSTHTPGFANTYGRVAASLGNVVVTPQGNTAYPPSSKSSSTGNGSDIVSQPGQPGRQKPQNGTPGVLPVQNPKDGAYNAPDNSTGTNTEPSGEGHLLNNWLGVRRPDFISITFSKRILGTPVTWTPSVTLDRYGKIYLSPLSGGFYYSAPGTPVSGSINWVYGQKPNENQLFSFLTGKGTSASATYIIGVSYVNSPGNGDAYGVAFGSPGVGISAGYQPSSFPFVFNTNLKW